MVTNGITHDFHLLLRYFVHFDDRSRECRIDLLHIGNGERRLLTQQPFVEYWTQRNIDLKAIND